MKYMVLALILMHCSCYASDSALPVASTSTAPKQQLAEEQLKQAADQLQLVLSGNNHFEECAIQKMHDTLRDDAVLKKLGIIPCKRTIYVALAYRHKGIGEGIKNGLFKYAHQKPVQRLDQAQAWFAAADFYHNFTDASGTADDQLATFITAQKQLAINPDRTHQGRVEMVDPTTYKKEAGNPEPTLRSRIFSWFCCRCAKR